MFFLPFFLFSLFSDLRSLAGTTLLSLLATLFMSQLLFVIGVGGIQVLNFETKSKWSFNDKRRNDHNGNYLLCFYAGYWTMFVTIISVAVHEISVVVLDLLLLSSFINYIPKKYQHIPTAWTENGQSFRSLQVRTEKFLRFPIYLFPFFLFVVTCWA